MLFIVDFDGTISTTDTVDELLERFADAEWKRVEARWLRNEIGSLQCMSEQLAMVHGERAELEEFFRSVPIDPDFAKFVSFVGEFADVAVVSDGLDYPIRHALRHIEVPIYSNALSFTEGGCAIDFPYFDAACEVKSGVCKCAVARAAGTERGPNVILIGDGRSDACLARRADYVFAKASLRRFCEAENIIHTPFETFTDVLTVIRSWHAPAHEGTPLRRPNVPW